MQELVGRLTALDPEASETLKVVSYFDALVSGGVGVEGLLRGASALADAVAGAELNGRVRRRDQRGGRPMEEPAGNRHPLREIPGGAVWIERRGAAHANDQMVVERLALAVELTEARRRPEGALEVAIDETRSLLERGAVLGRLGLEPATLVRVIALPPDRTADAPSTLVATRFGIVRASLGGSAPATGPVGIGVWVRADRLPDSWGAALIALRLTDARHPVVDATDLGALVLLAHAFDPDAPPDDVRVLDGLDDRTRVVLRELVEGASIRATASVLGMHHSTLQARHESLTRELGYDPRSALGRARYTAADLLLRLAP